MYSTTRLESNSSSSSQAFLNSLEDPMKEDVYSNFENVSFFDQQWNTLDFNFLEQYNQMFFDTPNNVEPVTPYKSTVYPSHTELDDLLVTNPTYDKSPLGKVSWRQSIFLEKKPKEIQECHISWTSSPSPVPTKINSIVSSTSEPLPERHDHLVSQEIFPNNTNLYEPKAWVAMPRRQKPRYEGDHYTPKWVRYTGHLKQGYCDSCSPGKWLQLKNSAYWYHKQFYHGISSVSGKPFLKPIKQRLGKGDTIEGLCHQCKRFVPSGNTKKKNNYMLWYRHAHKCHLYDKSRTTSSKPSSVSSATSMTD